MSGFAAGAHHHDHALGVGCADVIEQVILRGRSARRIVHRLLHDVRAGGVERIAGFARLEIDVRDSAPCRASPDGPASARARDARDHDSSSIIARMYVFVEQFDFRDFVRGAEAVEEMEERNAGFERRRLRDQREILRLLHRGRASIAQPVARAAMTSL